MVNSHFFQEHGSNPHYWNEHANWWKGARWGRVHHWLGWGVAYPVYYDEGGYPIQIEIDSDYDNQQETFSPNESWLPLGVFALGVDANQASYSNIFIQLAINSSGEIAGTYYNAATDVEYPIEGAADPETQAVYWDIDQGSSPQVMTTGMYNLTQDLVNIQITFRGGVAQNWVLVRINE